jgi:pimeloyl-ACP methyl ester carboxylesterase
VQEAVKLAHVDGIELEYELEGAGEPVVLIHAGVCAGFFAPLMGRLDHCVLRYHRCGYAGSSHVEGAVTLADHAAHCRELMQTLGIDAAHVVGHSSSASIALQLALDFPEAVTSLVLADPARPAQPTPVHLEMVKSVVQPALARYAAGDKAGAIDLWMRGVCGPGYREPLELALPGAVEQAVADADTFFGQELPAVMQWSFGPGEAARVEQPVLAVAGARSEPFFRERRDLLLAWLPHAEPFDLAGATHLLQVENPDGMAAALAAFFTRRRAGGEARPAPDDGRRAASDAGRAPSRTR